MERRGSGIKKILLAYENDEKKPKFEIIGDVFIVTFYSRLYRNVERNIKVLKDMGIVERIGSTKKGYWRINI